MKQDMAHTDIALQLVNLTKVYDMSIAGDRKGMTGNSSFKALDNISFELRKGDVLGIIGKNGSGKSTLLKIISEVVPPSSGSVTINGHVASLLDIGTGFHPDITGRENIYLNGALLGMDRKTILKKFDEIVHFSGIGPFIDLPVKKYSSGMFLRLAFSVMISLENSIILLDEILSVGDADFRLKSYNKIKALRGSDKAIIIVSHDLGSISDLCNKCMVLEQGKLIKYGDAGPIINAYMENALIDYVAQKREDERVAAETEAKPNEVNEKTNATTLPKEKSERKLTSHIEYKKPDGLPGNAYLKIHSVSVSAKGKSQESEIMMSDEIEFHIQYEKTMVDQTVPAILISSALTGIVMATTSERPAIDSEYTTDEGIGTFACRCTIPASFLHAGLYSVTLYFTRLDADDTVILYMDDVLHFKVNYEAYNIEPSPFVYKGGFKGAIYPLSYWQIKKCKL